MQIGLFFGSTTCYTEMAAEKIQQIIGEDIISLHNIRDEPLKNAEHFDFVIFGLILAFYHTDDNTDRKKSHMITFHFE